jgi:hypothetical protein
MHSFAICPPGVAAVKPYPDCSAASNDPYERSAARIHELMGIIERELAGVTGDSPPSQRIQDAVRDLIAEIDFMKYEASQGKHFFPPPDLTGIRRLCDRIARLLEQAERAPRQFDDRIKEEERKKEIATKVFKGMVDYITWDQVDAIVALILALVTFGASAPFTIGWMLAEVAMKVIDQLPDKPDFPAKSFALEHKDELNQRLMDQVNSKDPAYRDRLKEVLRKALRGESLTLRERQDMSTITQMILQQIKYIAREEKDKRCDDRINQIKTEKSKHEKKIENLKAYKTLCDQLPPPPLWTAATMTPGIQIDKKPSSTSISPGGTVTFTYTVTNTGNCDLSQVQVTDNKCTPVNFQGGDINGDNKLDPNEIWTYQCSVTLKATGNVINTATATAVGPTGTPVSHSAPATVNVTTKKVKVPDIYSLTREAAIYDIKEAKLKVGKVEVEASDLDPGLVTRQNPAAGTMIDVGKPVNFWLSGSSAHHIFVDPPRATIEVDSAVSFTATLIYDDGTEKDVTQIGTWNPGPNNIFVGKDPGTFIVSVEYTGITGSATVNVNEPEEPGWEPPISHADDTLANVPRPGPSDYTWYALCTKGTGEVVYGEDTEPTKYFIMGGPFPGPRTAKKWIDDNCPRWRCTLEGACADKPASGGDWNVFCDKESGAITIGTGPAGMGQTIIAGNFLGEPDARFWINQNCPTWRCTKDGACADKPARGGKWKIFCDTESGGVTIGTGMPGFGQVIMDEGFLGEPDARMWLDANCPRWRCTKDGNCAAGPATGGDWYVFCSDYGDIQLGHGNPGRKRDRVMADGFLGESDARLWVNMNCPSWRCDSENKCLLVGVPGDEYRSDADIDDAIDDTSPSDQIGDCDANMADFSTAASDLDGIAASFDDLSSFFDQQLRSFDPLDPRARQAACSDPDISYALNSARTAIDEYDVTYFTLAGLYGDVSASCIAQPELSQAQAEYDRLGQQGTYLEAEYSRMISDFGAYQCDEQSSRTDAGDKADDERDPDDLEAGVEVCDDGIDNDGDGEIDECDAGCCDKNVQVTVTDCGPAADDIFLIDVDGNTLGVTPKGAANTFNIELSPGGHSATITCLDDGGDPLGSDVGTACIWVVIYGGETIGGDELWIDYGGTATVGFDVPVQETAPPFPKVIDGSSLQHLEQGK